MRYAKALVALLVAALTALASVLTDEIVTDQEWLQVAIAVVTAAGVWLAPNVPYSRYTKAGIAVLLAALNFAVTVITGGITPAEWVNLVLAALGVLGVAAVPNTVRTVRAQPLPGEE